MIKRTTRWLVAIAAAFLISEPASASASDFPASCDIGVPAFVTLFPTSSTHVSPGEMVDVGIRLINVESRPSSTFFFKKAGGGTFTIPFDSGTDFRLAIPASWKFGRYRLVKIETRTVNATSTQLLSFALTGVDPDGVAHSGTCPLDLSVLDLVVSAGHGHRAV